MFFEIKSGSNFSYASRFLVQTGNIWIWAENTFLEFNLVMSITWKVWEINMFRTMEQQKAMTKEDKAKITDVEWEEWETEGRTKRERQLGLCARKLIPLLHLKQVKVLSWVTACEGKESAKSSVLEGAS